MWSECRLLRRNATPCNTTQATDWQQRLTVAFSSVSIPTTNTSLFVVVSVADQNSTSTRVAYITQDPAEVTPNTTLYPTTISTLVIRGDGFDDRSSGAFNIVTFFAQPDTAATDLVTGVVTNATRTKLVVAFSRLTYLQGVIVASDGSVAENANLEIEVAINGVPTARVVVAVLFPAAPTSVAQQDYVFRTNTAATFALDIVSGGLFPATWCVRCGDGSGCGGGGSSVHSVRSVFFHLCDFALQHAKRDWHSPP